MGVKLLNLDELLDAVPERTPDDLRSADVEVPIGGKPVVFRFTELGSREWARCTMAHSPREGVSLDAAFGYDLTLATEAAARLSGVIVDGEQTATVSPAQWEKIFAPGRLDAQGRQAITDAVFAVNEHAEIMRLQAAKKASAVVSKRKPRSPAK